MSGCAMTMLLDDAVGERRATWTLSGARGKRDGSVDRAGTAFRRKFRWER
jgi:hypothetical protein